MNQFEWNEERKKEVFLFCLVILIFVSMAILDLVKAIAFTAIISTIICAMTIRKIDAEKKEYKYEHIAMTKDEWKDS